MKIIQSFRDVQHLAIDIARKLDIIDTYHFHHSINVCLLSMSVGEKYGLSNKQLEELGIAAILHDIGKIKIPHYIWTMPNKPNELEWAFIKEHPMFSYEMIQEYRFPMDVCIGALHHHERLDGSGYPHELKANEISDYGKIIAIADVYDAMRSRRSYKEPTPHKEAIKFLVDHSGKSFDPDLLLAFKEICKE